MIQFKKFKAASVQTSPVFLNVEKTIDKAVSFIKEAAQNGAKLIAFPEVFVAGYPYWHWIMTPVRVRQRYDDIYNNSVPVDNTVMYKLYKATKYYHIHIIIGIIVLVQSYVEIYNTNL